ncbi:MAG TPA: hypothetical protein VGP68_10245, partial [Gemmataceae bacterium]|nr:hypothetical protein [Gemmataceae bacterium]
MGWQLEGRRVEELMAKRCRAKNSAWIYLFAIHFFAIDNHGRLAEGASRHPRSELAVECSNCSKSNDKKIWDKK